MVQNALIEKNKKGDNMKAINYILTLILTMSLSTVLATEDLVPEPAPAYIITAPTAPKEATFDDEYIPANNDAIPDEFMKSVEPVAPKEANFDYNNPEDLAPTASETAK